MRKVLSLILGALFVFHTGMDSSMASCIGSTYVACTTNRKTGDTNCKRTENSALCRHNGTIEPADYSSALVETNSGSCRSYCKGTTHYSCHSYPKIGDCVCAEEMNSSQCRVGDISIECGGNPIGSKKLTASLVGSVKAPLTSDTEEISAGQLRLALNESGHFLRECDIWKIDPRYSSINVSRQEFTIQAEDGRGETVRVEYPAEGGLFLRIGQSEMAVNSICRVGKKEEVSSESCPQKPRNICFRDTLTGSCRCIRDPRK